MKRVQWVYHVAEACNWAAIKETGLFSATALICQSGYSDAVAREMSSTYRPCNVVLPNGVLIRDQRPMPPHLLEKCLIGMVPEAWYRLVNSKIYFWFHPDRVQRHLNALSARPQIILKVSFPDLMQTYAQQSAVTPFNVGNARRRAAKRGPSSFVNYQAWLRTGWLGDIDSFQNCARPRHHPPAELAVDCAIPDIMSFVESFTPSADSEAKDFWSG